MNLNYEDNKLSSTNNKSIIGINYEEEEEEVEEEDNNEYTSIVKKQLKDDTTDSDEYAPIIKNKLDIKIAIIMTILGTGYLFPFESYLMSLDYFSMLYPDKKIYSTFPFLYMGAIAMTFLFFLKFPNFGSHAKRMVFGFGFYILIMITVPLINFTSIGGSFASYIITLILFILTGIVDGFVQGTVYAIAGLFGPQYTQFTQIGVGLAGLIVAITRIISKVSFPHTEHGIKVGSLVYFLVSAFIIFIALLSFLYLLKLPIADELRGGKDKKQIKPKNSAPYRFVFKKNAHLGLMNFFVFLLSMFLFPGIILEIPARNIRSDWFIITILTIHNLFDFIGKSIPIYLHPNGKRIPSTIALWILTLGRFVFVALFFLCIYTKTFMSDAWPIIFVSILAYLNGYICSIVMAEGPRIVKREYKELSGIFMTTCLIIGLTIGSSLNFLVVQLTK
eukprot:gene9910-12153_t